MSIPRILLVEDNPDDVELFRRALGKVGAGPEPAVAEDGEAAVDWLAAGRGPLPELVVLDLKLPRRSGLELLAWMRSKPGLAAIPVIVFTSSEEREDIERARSLGAAAYLVKPGGFEETCESARTIVGLGQALREGRPIAPQFPSGV